MCCLHQLIAIVLTNSAARHNYILYIHKNLRQFRKGPAEFIHDRSANNVRPGSSREGKLIDLESGICFSKFFQERQEFHQEKLRNIYCSVLRSSCVKISSQPFGTKVISIPPSLLILAIAVSVVFHGSSNNNSKGIKYACIICSYAEFDAPKPINLNMIT